MTSLFPPHAESLFGLARDFDDFANEHTERLSFDDHANVMHHVSQLLAFAFMLTACDRQAFLNEQLAEAAEYLQWLKARIGAQS